MRNIHFIILMLLIGMSDLRAQNPVGDDVKQVVVSKQDTWRYLIYFDSQEYREQQLLLAKELDTSDFTADNAINKFWRRPSSVHLEGCRTVARILKLHTKRGNSKFDKVAIKEYTIPTEKIEGYSISEPLIFKCPPVPGDIEFQLGTALVNLRAGDAQVKEEQWKEKLDLKPSTGYTSIRMSLAQAANRDDAETALVTVLNGNNFSPISNCNVLLADKGPGDVCVISVTESPAPHWEGQRIAFIRGRFMVYLRSSYENFDCMDLACKIDAALVQILEEAMKED